MTKRLFFTIRYATCLHHGQSCLVIVSKLQQRRVAYLRFNESYCHNSFQFSITHSLSPRFFVPRRFSFPSYGMQYFCHPADVMYCPSFSIPNRAGIQSPYSVFLTNTLSNGFIIRLIREIRGLKSMACPLIPLIKVQRHNDGLH